MRKLLIAIAVLALLSLAVLLTLRSESSLIRLAHWSVSTFTDLRLELKSPTIRPLQGTFAVEELHLYPKDDAGPPFLSVINLQAVSTGSRQNLLPNMAHTSVEAQQLVLYVSDRDATADPKPKDWISYLRWLPATLNISQIHVVNASQETYVFPLKQVQGQRIEDEQFNLTGEAEYAGEPLTLSIDVLAIKDQWGVTGIDLDAHITAADSGSDIALKGELRGSNDQLNYDFSLQGHYTNISNFFRGFKTESKLAGSLSIHADMKGDTNGFVLDNARFDINNLPDYQMKATGELSYQFNGDNSVSLEASMQIAAMDLILDWTSVDLRSLGSANGTAVISGSINQAVIESFTLNSQSDSGLVVNISGKVAPSSRLAEGNNISVAIEGPSLATLEQWTGPLSYEPGPFKASARLYSQSDVIALQDIQVELGDKEQLFLQLEGSAERIFRPQENEPIQLSGLNLDATLSSPNSLYLAQLLDSPIPSGFELSGNMQFSGDSQTMGFQRGKLTASSSDIHLTLSPTQGSLQLSKAPLLTDLKADLTLSVDDISALSQFTERAIPVLGPLEGAARLEQGQGYAMALKGITLSSNSENMKLTAQGEINKLSELTELHFNVQFSNVDVRHTLFANTDTHSIKTPMGSFGGSFNLSYDDQWQINNLNIATHEQAAPFRFKLSGEINQLLSTPEANLQAQYTFADTHLLQALIGLPMKPSIGTLKLKTTKGMAEIHNEAQIGDSQISLDAKVKHRATSIQDLELRFISPKIIMSDIGIQAGLNTQQSSPTSQLSAQDTQSAIERLLQQAPSYPTDIKIDIAGISGENTNIERLLIHSTGAEKRYTLRQFSVTYDQSVAEVRGIIDLNASPPFASIAGEAIAIPMRTLGQDLGINSNVRGFLTLRGGVSAQGFNTEQLLATLDGSVALALEDAIIDGAAYDVLATDLLAWFYSGAAAAKSTHIDCTMAQFQLLDGEALSDTLYIETEKMLATGTAKLNFDLETMDVKITPLSKSRNLQVPSSVRIRGSFDKPLPTISPIAAAADASAELLSLVPQLARKILGINRQQQGPQRPCVAGLK